MAEQVQSTEETPKVESAPATPPPPKRGLGHRGADPRDTAAELAARAHAISLEAGSKMAGAMRDVIHAAAGISGFVATSARDLVNFMVRRGQVSAEEAEKMIREAEEAHARRVSDGWEPTGMPPMPESTPAPAAQPAQLAQPAQPAQLAPAVLATDAPPPPPVATKTAAPPEAPRPKSAPPATATKSAAPSPAKTAAKAPAKGVTKTPAKPVAKAPAKAAKPAKSAAKPAAKAPAKSAKPAAKSGAAVKSAAKAAAKSSRPAAKAPAKAPAKKAAAKKR